MSMKETGAGSPRRPRAARNAPAAHLDVDPPADTPGGGNANGLTRVTINLNRKALNALEAVSEATGYSKTDTINRALLIYEFVREIMESDGTLRIPRENGVTDRYKLLGE
jgi:hypothetical protein